MVSSDTPANIYIVLGSYNGARYIAQQIASVQEQSHDDWRLLIRDDNSTDNTKHVIRAAANSDQRICLIEDDLGRLGVVHNFGLLLRAAYESGAEYVFLADQDDVWSRDKLRSQLAAIRNEEAVYGSQRPLLVHSDLAVVDGDLHRIGSSFMQYQGIRHEEFNSLATLLVQNFVTGCSTLVNRALLKIALPLPVELAMHDWWLALCAATFGKILYVDDQLVLYRQHGGNVVGADGRWLLNLFKGRIVKQWYRWQQSFQGSVYQAQQLCLRLQQNAASVPDTTAEFVRGYCDIFAPGIGNLQRLRNAAQLQIHRQGLMKTCALYTCIMTWRNQSVAR